MMKFTTPPPTLSKSLRKPWANCIAVGHAAELLREDVLTHLETAQKAVGWRYLRFHAVFSDQMNCVTRAEDGTLRFQWNHLDKVYDRILGMGLKPFVELNPMPTVLASTEQTIFAFKINVSPPADFAEWGQLVEAFTRHCVDRYGRTEVRSWYFEVWNEPNLPGFWGGSQADYWKLYETSAQAVKAVDSQLRIGGPASAAAAWVGEMIEHCHSRRIPLDFVSTHRYPQDEYSAQPDSRLHTHARGHFFGDEVKRIHDLVRASVLPDLEIHWTEWNSQSASVDFPVTWSANRFVDSSFAGSFIVKHCLELDEFSDSFAWWVVSDVFEEPGFQQAPFSCTYGLITVDGIPKSSFHAFRFLARLRGTTLCMEDSDELPGGSGIYACN
ncbi:MAG: hypothetical protein WD708_07595 [Kiritimatiellia bacterium]